MYVYRYVYIWMISLYTCVYLPPNDKVKDVEQRSNVDIMKSLVTSVGMAALASGRCARKVHAEVMSWAACDM